METLTPPAPDPAPESLEAWRDYADRWLAGALGPLAAPQLDETSHFAVSPLDGDGPCVMIPFSAQPGGRTRESYFAVVGRTEPNYYPRWGLSADEAFRLHVGTRFMLVVGVGQTSDERTAGFNPTEAVAHLVAQIAPGQKPSEARLVVMFDVGGDRHAVCRARIGSEEAYVFCGDAPPGFSRRVDLAPHVAYRLHLGALLLYEAEQDARDARQTAQRGPTGRDATR